MNPRLEIVEIGRRLHFKNMLSAADGNISFREASGSILITPTQLHKGFLKETDFARMDLSGKVLEGTPSSESAMHLMVFNQVKRARAVVHAHPIHAIALSIAFPKWKELPNTAMSELILACGRLPIVPYARPGTPAMGKNLLPFLPDHQVMILSRHGALAWGESLQEAYFGMERLEHTAQILHSVLMVGKLSSLPKSEIVYLKQLRKKIGDRLL